MLDSGNYCSSCPLPVSFNIHVSKIMFGLTVRMAFI